MAGSNSIECSSLEANLNSQKCRLNKINEIKDYFIVQIKEKELISKWSSKYITSFYYFNQFLIETSCNIQ